MLFVDMQINAQIQIAVCLLLLSRTGEHRNRLRNRPRYRWAGSEGRGITDRTRRARRHPTGTLISPNRIVRVHALLSRYYVSSSKRPYARSVSSPRATTGIPHFCGTPRKLARSAGNGWRFQQLNLMPMKPKAQSTNCSPACRLDSVS